MKPPRMRSMQARLTLLLGAIALLVSSLAGATLFWALKREVERQEITEVSGKLELINHLIDMQNSARGLHDLAATFDDMRTGQSQLGIWIVDAQGRPCMAATPPKRWTRCPTSRCCCNWPTAAACAACAWPSMTASCPART